MNLPDETIFAERDPPRKQPGDRFVIVYHGTLARRLGLDVAVRAVAELRKSIPCLELRIIGAGEERQRLVELTSELRLGDVVRFSDGYVPVTQIPAMIKDADIGVIPLRISSGTDIMLPTKLLEYVSMGIPCVVPRTGTICRYFDDDMVEFFEAENVGALASAIRRLYDDPVRRESLAREATARFGRAHRWGTHKQVYLDLGVVTAEERALKGQDVRVRFESSGPADGSGRLHRGRVVAALLGAGCERVRCFVRPTSRLDPLRA